MRIRPDGTVEEQVVPARVMHPIARSHLKDIKTWVPILSARGEEDGGWDWAQMLDEARQRMAAGTEAYDSFALVCEGAVQGAMIVEWLARTSRVTGRRLVYVEYIASAPQNRPALQQPPAFRGSGSVLMRTAATLSRSLGMGGVLGLHSKPRALPFYEKQGFVDLGPDAEEAGLHYMELHG
jgi:GNAT superfamily N-acetyltransferase